MCEKEKEEMVELKLYFPLGTSALASVNIQINCCLILYHDA